MSDKLREGYAAPEQTVEEALYIIGKNMLGMYKEMH